MERGAILEILKKESPFFISDIAEKYGIPEYKIRNAIHYHFFSFKSETVREKKRGRPKKRYVYVGKTVRYDRR